MAIAQTSVRSFLKLDSQKHLFSSAGTREIREIELRKGWWDLRAVR